jgi:hypothetical protein
MTDISPWHRLIHRATKADLDSQATFANLDFPGPLEYGMVPLDNYQVGNLLAFFDGIDRLAKESYERKLGCFVRPELVAETNVNVNTGDWWLETVNILCEYVNKLTKHGPDGGLYSNNSWHFYFDDEKQWVMARRPGPKPGEWVNLHPVMM